MGEPSPALLGSFHQAPLSGFHSTLPGASCTHLRTSQPVCARFHPYPAPLLHSPLRDWSGHPHKAACWGPGRDLSWPEQAGHHVCRRLQGLEYLECGPDRGAQTAGGHGPLAPFLIRVRGTGQGPSCWGLGAVGPDVSSEPTNDIPRRGHAALSG